MAACCFRTVAHKRAPPQSLQWETGWASLLCKKYVGKRSHLFECFWGKFLWKSNMKDSLEFICNTIWRLFQACQQTWWVKPYFLMPLPFEHHIYWLVSVLPFQALSLMLNFCLHNLIIKCCKVKWDSHWRLLKLIILFHTNVWQLLKLLSWFCLG